MQASIRSYRLAGAALALGPAIAAAQVATAPTYHLGSLPGAGTQEARAYAINAVGQTVGSAPAGGEDDGNHSMLWFNGISTDLDGVVHFELLHPYLGVPKHEAYDISNGGQIVGTHQLDYECDPVTTRMTMAYVLQPAVLSDLGTPFAGDAVIRLGTLGGFCIAHDSAATAVSNANHVVGWADKNTRAGITHAFMVVPQNGTWGVDVLPPANPPTDPEAGDQVNDLMIDLWTLDAYSAVSAATAVNDYGVVTGYSYTITNTLNGQAAYHAFRIVPQGGVWYVDAGNGPCEPCGANGQGSSCNQCGSNALMQSIGTLGGLNSWGRGINNAGVIVGESETADRHVRAFKWDNGAMTDLGTLGGDNSSASGINEQGHICGWAEDSRGSRRACVWINGQIHDLNSRLLATQGGGTQLQEARDINDHGQIVGWARGTDGTTVIETAFSLRIASQAEIEEANAIVAGQQTSSDDSSGVDNGVPGGSSTSGSGTGVQVNGTPQTVDGATDEGAVDGGATAGPAGLCGTGLASMSPLMLGLLAARVMRRR